MQTRLRLLLSATFPQLGSSFSISIVDNQSSKWRLEMSFSDFTSLYGTTTKAKFWCDYMRGLRGQLQALDSSKARESPSVWSRVATSEVLLYDVLYGEYFPAVGNLLSLHWPLLASVLLKLLFLERNPLTTNSFLTGSDPDPPEIRLPYCPVHSKIYGNTASRTSRIS